RAAEEHGEVEVLARAHEALVERAHPREGVAPREDAVELAELRWLAAEVRAHARERLVAEAVPLDEEALAKALLEPRRAARYVHDAERRLADPDHRRHGGGARLLRAGEEPLEPA